MNRKLIENYCRQVLHIKQEVANFEQTEASVWIEFQYSEKYVYQENITIPLLDLISFIYSSSAKKQINLK